jgi:hypothetical protein
MNTIKNALLFLLLSAVFVGASQAVTYLWFTDSEMADFGDASDRGFGHGDTLDGPVRSNSEIAISGDPIFYDVVITSASDFWRGSTYDPQFLGPAPVFRAARLPMPHWPETVANCASAQGNYFAWSGYMAMLVFDVSLVAIYRWPEGVPFDSTGLFDVIYLTQPTCLYFDCTVRVKGIVSGQVTLGSSQQIQIEDDIRYADADSLTGATPDTSHNLLALVAADDIKIRNTPANGRWNSGGLGLNQTNRNSASVVITALLYAGGSFTFGQQNDPDSGYVFDGTPDDRGTVYVYGGIYQRQRGYVHRSNLGSTGYLKHIRYDQRLRNMLPLGLYDPEIVPSGTTDTLDFGEVAVGTTVWDTAQVYTYFPGTLGSVYASYPFWAVRTPPFEGFHFTIPVRFTPPGIGQYRGFLSVSTAEHYYQIPLVGRGVRPPDSLSLAMQVAPNPFNLVTTIRYILPTAAAVKITLYDILGRVAKQVDVPQQSSGEHAFALDASGLASGVYFTRIEAAGQFATQKILLLK